jgi:hypothetical protein
MALLERFPQNVAYLVFRLVNAPASEVRRQAIKITFADGSSESPELAGANAVATVGDRAITVSAFRQAYEVAIRGRQAIYDGQVTMEQLRGLGIHMQVLQQLIDDQVTVLEAQRLNIRVTDEQVMASIMSMPAFQSGGRFVGTTRYAEILAAQTPPISPEQFMEAARLQLYGDALARRVEPRTGSDAEKTAAVRTYLDKARAAFRIIISTDVVARVVDEVTRR